jgi:hypothetical protein
MWLDGFWLLFCNIEKIINKKKHFGILPTTVYICTLKITIGEIAHPDIYREV